MLSNKFLFLFLSIPTFLFSAAARCKREMVSISATCRFGRIVTKDMVEVPRDATTKELVLSLNAHFGIDLDDGNPISYWYQGYVSKIIHCPHPDYKTKYGASSTCRRLKEVKGDNWVSCPHRQTVILGKLSKYLKKRILVIRHHEDDLQCATS